MLRLPQMEIGLPDADGRLAILRIHTEAMRKAGLLGDDVDLPKLAAATRNFSGAELAGLVRSAASFAMDRLLNPKDQARAGGGLLRRLLASASALSSSLAALSPYGACLESPGWICGPFEHLVTCVLLRLQADTTTHGRYGRGLGLGHVSVVPGDFDRALSEVRGAGVTKENHSYTSFPFCIGATWCCCHARSPDAEARCVDMTPSGTGVASARVPRPRPDGPPRPARAHPHRCGAQHRCERRPGGSQITHRLAC